MFWPHILHYPSDELKSSTHLFVKCFVVIRSLLRSQHIRAADLQTVSCHEYSTSRKLPKSKCLKQFYNRAEVGRKRERKKQSERFEEPPNDKTDNSRPNNVYNEPHEHGNDNKFHLSVKLLIRKSGQTPVYTNISGQCMKIVFQF